MWIRHTFAVVVFFVVVVILFGFVVRFVKVVADVAEVVAVKVVNVVYVFDLSGAEVEIDVVGGRRPEAFEGKLKLKLSSVVGQVFAVQVFALALTAGHVGRGSSADRRKVTGQRLRRQRFRRTLGWNL